MGHNVIADTVRRMAEGFAADIELVQMGVIDDRTPEPARLALAAALVYIGEPGDLMPDSVEGIGIMDDAAIIRLACRAAILRGSTDLNLLRLGREADDLAFIFGDLVVSLDQFLTAIQQPDGYGNTPLTLIADPERRMRLWQKLNERRETAPAECRAALAMDSSDLTRTMRNVIRDRLAELESSR